MYGTTNWRIVWVLVVLGLFLSAARGAELVEQAGWLMQGEPAVCGYRVRRGVRWYQRVVCRERWGSYWHRLGRTWRTALVRSLVIWVLWAVSGRVGWAGWGGLPWLIWALPGWGGNGWRVKRILWQVQQVVILGYMGFDVVKGMGVLGSRISLHGWMGVGCLAGKAEGVGEEAGSSRVEVERQADGGYRVSLRGPLTLRLEGGASPFQKRMLMVFLGLLQGENDGRRSRRTRDGRTPLVRQEQLASWFGEKQEVISRYMQYWLQGDWANLLSLKSAEVLTFDLVERIVTALASFPTWTSEQVYQYLRQQNVKVTYAQVEQAAEQSGWCLLQKALCERYEWTASSFHLREAWLVEQLLAQVESLLTQLEAAGQGITPQVLLSLTDLRTLASLQGVEPEIPYPVRPWMSQIEQVLFTECDQTAPEVIRCPYCGSTDTSPKSKQPRWKTFRDANGQLQRLAVYRHYCHNPECSYRTFTHFPAGLVPYSHCSAQIHLLALQMYAWGYSTYRRTGTALGVSSVTAFLWVSEWGHKLLPVAALFGVLKSSGVVGVDEKYVLVPKNNKPAGDMRRWMYVYLAVDVWTYDLLHIAIYPFNNLHSAKAFLLVLRTKGYHPDVIITDLRQDYGTVIPQVFPSAIHHLCIFHALQNVQKHVKDIYGPNYAQDHPEAQQLKQLIYNIFDTQSPSEALFRYQQVLALKDAYTQTTPASTVIFDFLVLHWPKLVNAIGSDKIPTTNNATELVIRRFDQHYQNFCGFESIKSAQRYLGVFEKVYRFTPFSQDAQPRIRGKSPLQLAGYDISHLPMTAICSGLSIDLPVGQLKEALVPN